MIPKDALQVHAPDGTRPAPRFDAALTELKSPRADSLVGGGALTATLDGKTVELVRNTNAKQREIGRFTPRSQELAEAGLWAQQTWKTVFPVLTLTQKLRR